ncbi:MAG: hypothetical protein Q8936_11230 [Bacillota bacterium]|nr:hypothetical protein [Bacillota bacterium]
MSEIIKLLFLINFSLFLVHEMDAVKQQEWKMLIWLKNLEDEKAYKIFTAIHIPLYVFLLFGIMDTSNNTSTIFLIIIDVFLIFHASIHFFFKKHKNNEFNSYFSKIVINAMAIISVAQIILLKLTA